MGDFKMRYSVWVDDNHNKIYYYTNKKQALRKARSARSLNLINEEAVLVQKGSGYFRGKSQLFFINNKNKLQRCILTDFPEKIIRYRCLPYKYNKKEVPEFRYTKYDNKPRFRNSNYYNFILNKYKQYNYLPLYEEFMKLVKYLCDNRYKITVKLEYGYKDSDVSLACYFKNGNIKGAFTTENKYAYGNINGRVGMDNSGCGNKWSQVPVSLNLKDLDFKVFESQIDYLKSKECYESSNSYKYEDNIKFINHYHESDYYREFLTRNKIELEYQRVLLSRDIYCPKCNVKTTKVSDIDDLDTRTDECPTCNTNYQVALKCIWDITDNDNWIEYKDEFNQELNISFNDEKIEEYHLSIKRDVLCPECNKIMRYFNNSPLYRTCDKCNLDDNYITSFNSYPDTIIV